MTPDPNALGEHVTGPYTSPPLFGWSTAGCPVGATIVAGLAQWSSAGLGWTTFGWCLWWLAAIAIPTPTMSETAATATPANPIRLLTNTSRCFE
jgi:hypothetical protein